MGASRQARNGGNWERGHAILRHRVERDFTIIPNAVIRDRRLGFKEFGVLAFLLHLPADFRVTVEWISRQKCTGKYAIRAAIQQLQALGYMGIDAHRDDRGRFLHWVWWVTDCPGAVNCDSRPVSGFPQVGNPQVENRTLLSTNKHQELSGTTTTAPAPLLTWPRGLPEAERVVVEGLIEGLEQRAAQAVLDELAGLMAANRVRSSRIALLRALVARVRDGTFVPAHGPAVAARRAQEADEGRKRRAARAKQSACSPELAKARLAEIAAALRSPGSL